MFEMDEVLQLAGRVDAVGAVAGDEPGRPGTFSSTRGEHDGAGVDPDSAFWGGDVQRAVAGPVGGHRVGHDRGPGRGGPLPQDARVARTADEPAHVPDAVAKVIAVTRDAAGVALPLQNQYLAAEPRREVGGCAQTSRARADDDDLRCEYADRPEPHGGVGGERCIHRQARAFSALPPRVSSSSPTSAPQKKPWQRPFWARVRRRRPDTVVGGIGEVKASRISPAVTRSQKQTILPYAGSAAMRSASWYGRGNASPMLGIRGGAGRSGRAVSWIFPLSASSSSMWAATAMPEVRPVERMPPASTYCWRASRSIR